AFVSAVTYGTGRNVRVLNSRLVMQMTGPPVTLDDLIRDDKLLWVYCCDCGHERDVTPATIPLPPETPVPDVGKHMKCSKCGSRKDQHEARALSGRRRSDARAAPVNLGVA